MSVSISIFDIPADVFIHEIFGNNIKYMLYNLRKTCKYFNEILLFYKLPVMAKYEENNVSWKEVKTPQRLHTLHYLLYIEEFLIKHPADYEFISVFVHNFDKLKMRAALRFIAEYNLTNTFNKILESYSIDKKSIYEIQMKQFIKFGRIDSFRKFYEYRDHNGVKNKPYGYFKKFLEYYDVRNNNDNEISPEIISFITSIIKYDKLQFLHYLKDIDKINFKYDKNIDMIEVIKIINKIYFNNLNSPKYIFIATAKYLINKIFKGEDILNWMNRLEFFVKYARNFFCKISRDYFMGEHNSHIIIFVAKKAASAAITTKFNIYNILHAHANSTSMISNAAEYCGKYGLFKDLNLVIEMRREFNKIHYLQEFFINSQYVFSSETGNILMILIKRDLNSFTNYFNLMMEEIELYENKCIVNNINSLFNEIVRPLLYHGKFDFYTKIINLLLKSIEKYEEEYSKLHLNYFDANIVCNYYKLNYNNETDEYMEIVFDLAQWSNKRFKSIPKYNNYRKEYNSFKAAVNSVMKYFRKYGKNNYYEKLKSILTEN